MLLAVAFAIALPIALAFFFTRKAPEDYPVVAFAKSPITLKPPASFWTTSERDNPTFTKLGLCISVFAQDQGWKYSIAEENEDDEDDRENVQFSAHFETQNQAKIAAMSAFLAQAPEA